MWLGREIYGLSGNGPTSYRYPNPEQKELFRSFRNFVFFFYPSKYYSIKPTNIWVDREFEGISENGPTSNRHPNPRAKNNYFRFLDIFLYFFLLIKPTKLWIDTEF